MSRRVLIAVLGVFVQAFVPLSAGAGRDLEGPDQPTARAASRTPVVVELFTSEGCSSCPPADVLLQRLVENQPLERVEIIGLSQHVDYWDELGWKDRFSSAALTNRQRIYGARISNDAIYTPQMIIDGRIECVGSDARAARTAIDRALAAGHGLVRLRIDRDNPNPSRVAVTVETSALPVQTRGDRADIVVAVTEDHLRTEVKRGENRGRTLVHTAVVRELRTIGEAAVDASSSAHAEIPLAAEWHRDELKIVAFVQERRGRAILASAVAPLAHR